ncbi:DUF5715 family protein [Vaginella massiliensis]|uniref:DUF5715 family protein n=1 Tax=Vaginella massiliensis TaxID=1816680 RepID=UPI000839687C|nr:DUF5715 family protein [Vaginella massiliensis]
MRTFFVLFLFLIFSTTQAQATIEPTKEYLTHLSAAKSHGVDLIINKEQLDKYINRGKLIKVKQRGYGFRVANLSHSHSYLVPKGQKVLADIAREFVRTTGQNFFIVTSLTRTLDDQNRLRRVNTNASSNDSSHNFGAAFDISYVRFNHKHERNLTLEKELENVLKIFQKQGKIYYVKENKMKCYHVIVRKY